MAMANTVSSFFVQHPRIVGWCLLAFFAAIRLSFFVHDGSDVMEQEWISSLPPVADRSKVERHLAFKCNREHFIFCSRKYKRRDFRLHQRNNKKGLQQEFAWISKSCSGDDNKNVLHHLPLSISLLEKIIVLPCFPDDEEEEEQVPSREMANSTELDLFLSTILKETGVNKYFLSRAGYNLDLLLRVLLDLLDESVDSGGEESIVLMPQGKLLPFHSVSRKEAWALIERNSKKNLPTSSSVSSSTTARSAVDDTISESDSTISDLSTSRRRHLNNVPAIPVPFTGDRHDLFRRSRLDPMRRAHQEDFSHQCVRNVLENGYDVEINKDTADGCTSAYFAVAERFREIEVLYDLPLANILFWVYVLLVPLAYAILNPPKMNISGESKKQKRRRQLCAALEDAKLRDALERKAQSLMDEEAAAAYMLKLEERAARISQEDGEMIKDDTWKDEEARRSSLEARLGYIRIYRCVLLGFLACSLVLLWVDATQVRRLIDGIMVLILDWQATYWLIPAENDTKKVPETTKLLTAPSIGTTV